ncbi:MAG: hypothetical protein ABI481_01345 [Pyrinomonadaceae bacterium]
MGRTNRNILLALILAVPLSVIATSIYIFYPLIWAIVTSQEGAGIGSGIGGGGVGLMLILGAMFFLIIFSFLQWKATLKTA